MIRLGTFWLRPDFVLRVLNRFQAIAGFDRAMALASSALTAMIPITIIVGALLPASVDPAARIIDRYDLTGSGAEAVKEAFQPATEVTTSIGFIGFFLLVYSLLSFTRAMQRLFETTWDLPSLSVRNTLGGAKWLISLILYLGITGWVADITEQGRGDFLAVVLLLPLMAGFFAWSGRALSGYRISWQDLLPFAVLAAILIGVYEVGASFYTPHAFNTYSERYGVIGVVFAMISALFGFTVTLVGSAALGREVRIELDNIRDGVRPSEDELKNQWDLVWQGVREQRAAIKQQWATFRGRFKRSGGDESSAE